MLNRTKKLPVCIYVTLTVIKTVEILVLDHQRSFSTCVVVGGRSIESGLIMKVDNSVIPSWSLAATGPLV